MMMTDDTDNDYKWCRLTIQLAAILHKKALLNVI